MSNKIEQILELAEVDARIFELTLQMKRIPERLNEAKKHLDVEQAQFDEINTPWSEADHKIREKEATIQIALETIGKFEEHMTRVTTQKEYMAAKKQVDEARKLNELLQNDILELRVVQEELGPKLEEVTARYNNVKEDYEAQAATIQEELAGLQKESAGFEARVAELAKAIDPRAEGHYDYLNRGNKRPAIVPVINSTCTGCNMAMLPQAYNTLCAQNGEFFTCPTCNRMVFIKPVTEEEAAAAAAAEEAEKAAKAKKPKKRSKKSEEAAAAPAELVEAAEVIEEHPPAAS